jgi:hypothetical protein
MAHALSFRFGNAHLSTADSRPIRQFSFPFPRKIDSGSLQPMGNRSVHSFKNNFEGVNSFLTSGDEEFSTIQKL